MKTLSGIMVPRHWTLGERLAYYTAPPNERGCTLWTRWLMPAGYGGLKWKRKSRSAHRLMWEWVNGPIPSGLCVCHRCDVPACVNIDHLWLDTQAANMADMKAKSRKACLAGEGLPQAKITASMVLAIRADTRPQRTIAAQYGIGQAQVGRIKLRKRWAHI